VAVRGLIEKERYNPAILPQLEAYVEEQVTGGTYDREANLAVLKLYQFYPEKTNLATLIRILIKALMNLPHTDFTLCLYLISERTQDEKELVALKEAHDLLETAQFSEFWSRLEREDDTAKLLKAIPGFVGAIQHFIVSVLTLTYQNIPTQTLMETLRLEEGQLSAFVATHADWRKEGDIIAFPRTEFNQAKQKKIKEHIDMTKMSNVMALLRSEASH